MKRSSFTTRDGLVNLIGIALVSGYYSMERYSPYRKGRQKVVSKFTTREGAWILGVVVIIMVRLMVLWIHGYINFDQD